MPPQQGTAAPKTPLTFDNLSKTGSHQPLETWAKQPQRQEAIAVGAKTKQKASLTTNNVSRVQEQPDSQLKGWADRPQRQEKIATGGKTSKSLGRKGDWLGEMEERADGRGA